jgi:alpha-tubulin suppressor-like RCC1 family protein
VGLSNVVNIGAGRYHSFAVKSDGSVVVWGIEAATDYGDGTIGDADGDEDTQNSHDSGQMTIPGDVTSAETVYAGTHGHYHSQMVIDFIPDEEGGGGASSSVTIIGGVTISGGVTIQ